MVFCQGFPSLRGLYGSPAGAALVWTLTSQTNPAWLDLPGAQGSRRHNPGGRKVTQASPPRQGTTPREDLLTYKHKILLIAFQMPDLMPFYLLSVRVCSTLRNY